MTEIQIAVIDKIPSVIGNVKCIVADNSDYSVRFSFDDDWNDGEKKVYFVLDDGFAYPPVTITGDTVTLPRQVKGGIGRYLYIGVEQNGIRTSKGIGLNVLASITDMIDDDAVQPELSMWEDVLARVEALEKNGGGSGKGVMTGSGAPATATEAETGVLYMDTDTGYMYKCLGTDVDDAGATIYVWEPMPQVPMVVEAVLAEDGTFVSPMPFAELEAAISLGTVKLVASMDVTEEKNGETVFVEYRLLIAELTAEIPTGTLYTMSAAGAYTSVPVLVTVGEAEGGIVSGAYMKAPPAGITSGAGGLMAFMMPLTIPCEGYSTKYYQINSPTDVTELTVEQMREAWLAGTLTLASAADIGADTASQYAVFRSVKKTIEDDKMDFLGTYWAEGDAPYAHDQIPLTAQIDADGKITIKETAMESDMLYLTGNGSLPGKCSPVYDKSLTKWTAEMLIERVRIVRSPVMLSIHQDALDAADITARTGNFRLIETSSAAIAGEETATFHGEYWDSGTNAWVPAVAVMDNAGAVTVTDASWAAVDELSEAIADLPQADYVQNDESAKDYIKNRTHYTKDPVHHDAISDMELEFEDWGYENAYCAWVEWDYIPGIHELNNISLVIDGVNYSGIGNESLVNPAADNGESFYLWFFNYEDYCGVEIYVKKELGASHTISLSYSTSEVVRIPEKYIPEVATSIYQNNVMIPKIDIPDNDNASRWGVYYEGDILIVNVPQNVNKAAFCCDWMSNETFSLPEAIGTRQDSGITGYNASFFTSIFEGKTYDYKTFFTMTITLPNGTRVIMPATVVEQNGMYSAVATYIDETNRMYKFEHVQTGDYNGSEYPYKNYVTRIM